MGLWTYWALALTVLVHTASQLVFNRWCLISLGSLLLHTPIPYHSAYCHPYLVGHLVYAEILINYLQGVMKGLGPAVAHPQQRQSHPVRERDEIGVMVGELGARAAGSLGSGLPPPLSPGNWEEDGGRCFMNRDIEVSASNCECAPDEAGGHCNHFCSGQRVVKSG